MRRPKVWLVGIGAMAAVVAIILGIAAIQEELTGRPAAAWFTPFFIGAVIASFPCLAWIAVTSADGSATWRIGAEAEVWTAEALRGLGPDWRIEHAVPFPERNYVVDVDHVAIGPYGVLVVETKWTGQAFDLSQKRLAPQVTQAMEQVDDNANRVRALLRRVNSGVPIIPVVVYWGPNVIPPSTPVRREGDIRLVAGKQGDDWRVLLSRDRMNRDVIDRLVDRVQGWRVEQEQHAIGGAVAARLHSARELGRACLGLVGLMVALPAIGHTSGPAGDALDSMFKTGGAPAVATLLFLPLAVGLAGMARVWAARRLDPGIPWRRHLLPLGLWVAGFVGLMLAAP
jgi:hypothetical protein